MNKNQRITILLFALFGVLGALTIFRSFFTNKKIAQPTAQNVTSQPLQLQEITKIVPTEKHIPLKFDLVNKLKGFSKKQIEEHEELYNGYVNKRNEIAEQLKTADLSKANNVTSSPFRGLKLAETFAMNGDILHRLYFQNMGNQGSHIGKETLKLIEDNFGSLQAFKDDLFATAKSARGWAITGYTLDEGRIHNYLFDTHNQMVPVMIIPLLVLDVYEHAYMIDFGIKRVPYLDVFWENINWDSIEERAGFINKYSQVWQEYFR